MSRYQPRTSALGLEGMILRDDPRVCCEVSVEDYQDQPLMHDVSPLQGAAEGQLCFMKRIYNSRDTVPSVK